MTALLDERTGLVPDFSGSAPLGDTGWQVCTAGLLRSAGFPADGLDGLAGPRAAAAAAAFHRGEASFEAFVAAYDTDAEAGSAHLSAVAGDERLRLAVGWQNRTMYRVLDSLRSPGTTASKRRYRERALAMYWQRYCAKAETIGFFGPIAWLELGVGDEVAALGTGPRIVARRAVALERWMVAALGDWMAAEPGARWWFPPVLRPDVHLDADRRQLWVPGRGPSALSADAVAVLAHADGSRHAEDIVDALAASTGIADPAAARRVVERTLQGLLRKRLLTWDANIPVTADAEQVLAERVAAIGDPALFARFDTALTRVLAARDDVAAARGAAELVEALETLDATFVAITAREASRGNGQAYAGRTLCYEDTTRDSHLRLGQDFLDQLSRPLALVADSAAWFGHRLAERYEDAISGIVRDAMARRRGAPVTLADVWNSTLGLFWGSDPHPLTEATREVSERWTAVLGLPECADGLGHRRRVDLTVDELADRARTAFPRPSESLPQLDVHSPDLQLAAASVDAINAGDYTVVLGELHACLTTLDMACVDWTLGRSGTIRTRLNAQASSGRPVPLFPEGWRRNTGRFVPTSHGEGERLIGFAKAPVRDRSLVDPAVSLTFAERDGRLVAVSPTGRTWTIPELYTVPLSMVAADAFKIGLTGAWAPRLTIDGLVVFRETWKVPAAGVGLPAKPDRHRDFLAVRAWACAAGLPDRVFAKLPHETKPVFLDLSSPVLVHSFCTLVRAAAAEDPESVITVTETLPDPRNSWLPDAEGRRYVSEIRLQLSRSPR